MLFAFCLYFTCMFVLAIDEIQDFKGCPIEPVKLKWLLASHDDLYWQNTYRWHRRGDHATYATFQSFTLRQQQCSTIGRYEIINCLKEPRSKTRRIQSFRGGRWDWSPQLSPEPRGLGNWQQNDDMRECFPEIALQSVMQHYYSRDFARHAHDNEMSLNEYVANVAWEIADAMLIAKDRI